MSIELDIALEFGTKVLLLGLRDGEFSRVIGHQSDAQIEVYLTWKNSIRKFKMVGNFENIGSI